MVSTVKSENRFGYNMKLNLDNIRSNTFNLVQFTVETSQIKTSILNINVNVNISNHVPFYTFQK